MEEKKKRVEENAKKWEGEHEEDYTTQGLDSIGNLVTGLKLANKLILEVTRFMRALETKRKAMGISYKDLAEILSTTEEHVREIMLIEDQASTFELFYIAAALKCKILLFDECDVD